MADTVVAVVALGHDGLPAHGTGQARSAIKGVLVTHGAELLGEFLSGTGTWDGITETCDAWLCAIPTHNLPHVRTCLAHLARKFGQDGIGLIIHDDRQGVSCVEAEA